MQISEAIELLRPMTKEQRGDFLMKTISEALAAQLRSIRAARNLTQRALAERAGISTQTISRIESGDILTVNVNTLLKIAGALDCALHISFVGWPEWLKTYFCGTLNIPVPFAIVIR